MVNFNWKTLHEKNKGDCKRILKAMSRLQYDYPGYSYILDLPSLLSHRGSTAEDKVVYLWFCSLRNYADYAIADDVTLSRNVIEVNDSDIKRNPLLTLKDGKIYFLFEEKYKNGKKF